MHLETIKGSANIPEGMVKLSKEEALDYQKNVIDNWPTLSEVFFLRYGRYISSANAFFGAAACINVFHPILKLTRGTITGVIPALVLPPAFVFYKTDSVLTNEIVTLKMDCPLCYHFKFTAFQLYASLVFPSFLGMLNAYDGHSISIMKGDTKEYWKKTLKIGAEKIGIFKIVLVSQVLMSLALPYLQNEELQAITKKLKENPMLFTSEFPVAETNIKI